MFIQPLVKKKLKKQAEPHGYQGGSENDMIAKEKALRIIKGMKGGKSYKSSVTNLVIRAAKNAINQLQPTDINRFRD